LLLISQWSDLLLLPELNLLQRINLGGPQHKILNIIGFVRELKDHHDGLDLSRNDRFLLKLHQVLDALPIEL
jgi:hypothetical protein